MTRPSKFSDSIRIKPTRKKKTARVEEAPVCDHPECDKPGPHRAPRGRGQEGKFYNFCIDHVREYNKTYNYFSGMDPNDVIAYQRDSATGHRPTWKLGMNASKRGRRTGVTDAEMADPLGILNDDDDAEAFKQRRTRRTVLASHRRAFETLDLDESAERPKIRAQFKALAKRHHPDVNGGDRSGENRLREIIQAYNTLKSAGFC